MKQFFSAILLLLAFVTASFAQTPLYIQFDPNCVNQLEYEYTYSGQNLLMYSIAKGDNELYFFKIANTEPTTTAAPPKGMVSCQNAVLNASVMDGINAGGRLAYIVFRVQNGYTALPIESGGHITRSGSYFAFRSPNYDFVMDTANLDYARNLSQPGFASPVYLTGRRLEECLRLYAFRLEPLQPESPRADVEVIPGIGIISDRTGRNGVEMEQNVYRLLKVNSVTLDNYLYAFCRGQEKSNSNAGSFITNQPQNQQNNDGNYYPYDPFSEPDKEGYKPRPTNPGSGQPGGLANCPERPGYGYHIVQPGESLNYIARLYSLDTKSLIAWNNIKQADKIEVCQKIWLSAQQQGNDAVAIGKGKPNNNQPASVQNQASGNAAKSGIHIVQKGETISSISRKHGITEATLRSLNKFPASGNVIIQPGQQLAISKSGTVANSGKTGVPSQYSYEPEDNEFKPADYNNNETWTPPGSSSAGNTKYRAGKNEDLAGIAQKHGYTPEYFRHMNRYQKDRLPTDDYTTLPEGMELLVSDCACQRSHYSAFKPDKLNEKQGEVQTYNYDAPASKVTPPSIFNPQDPPPAKELPYHTYLVKNGETLASIAKDFGMSVSQLAKLNNLRPDHKLKARDELKIPK